MRRRNALARVGSLTSPPIGNTLWLNCQTPSLIRIIIRIRISIRSSSSTPSTAREVHPRQAITSRRRRKDSSLSRRTPHSRATTAPVQPRPPSILPNSSSSSSSIHRSTNPASIPPRLSMPITQPRRALGNLFPRLRIGRACGRQGIRVIRATRATRGTRATLWAIPNKDHRPLNRRRRCNINISSNNPNSRGPARRLLSQVRHQCPATHHGASPRLKAPKTGAPSVRHRGNRAMLLLRPRSPPTP
jgi:hypothetical protein